MGYHCKEVPCLVLLIGPVHNALFCSLVRYTTLFFCLLVRYRLLCFVEWSGKGRFVLLIGPVQDALFLVIGPVHDACFAYWSGTERFLLLNGPVQNAFFGSWTVTVEFVFRDGPVGIALLCRLVQYRLCCFAYWSGT